MENSFIGEFNKEFKKLYFDYNRAVSENDFDKAIEIGERILKGLIKISKEHILGVLRNSTIKDLVEDIIAFHEKNLAFIEGTCEAIKDMPVLFTFDTKERAVELLSSSISEFFSFVLGALIILADLEATARNYSTKNEDKSSVPRVM